ncbi:unnamed protein product [Schistocephalus solidus]|uniref:Ras-GAP domain-containing protein n=1 Tax=Schistocephalus solidus TaxID=70667 RepID=A0A0X3NX84_SCHSO|nr:unnamed protein product [Schistocephalus solidus]
MIIRQSCLSDGSVPSVIIAQADFENRTRTRNSFKKYLQESAAVATNPLLDSLASISGMPQHTFLGHMSAIGSYSTTKKINIDDKLRRMLHTISGFSFDGDRGSEEGPRATVVEKCLTLRELCELANSQRFFPPMRDWMEKHSTRFNQLLTTCLTAEQPEVAQEACLAIAYLARKFNNAMLGGMEQVISSLVRLLAILMVPRENQITVYRKALEQHADLQLIRATPQPFHFPRQSYSFTDVHHHLISCVYYTIADLLYNIPNPSLLVFFECRIFRRREMTRTLLFRILSSVSQNISELREQAESLEEPMPPKENEEAFTAETARRAKISEVWDRLPARMYTEILRVYHDFNAINKELILEIMEFLKASSPIKLAIFGDETIRALEIYTGHTAEGHPTETVKIKRQSKRISLSEKPTNLEVHLTGTDLDADEDDESSFDSDEDNDPQTWRPSVVPDRIPSFLNYNSGQ